ncbi:hypothetical protein [Streptomyces sp. DW26H14]|uniref:hypothetical protein n=1 Tax=Streptomyces sp. DW26H14 TaxID=3435395 RepID=UPI00403DD397
MRALDVLPTISQGIDAGKEIAVRISYTVENRPYAADGAGGVRIFGGLAEMQAFMRQKIAIIDE